MSLLRLKVVEILDEDKKIFTAKYCGGPGILYNQKFKATTSSNIKEGEIYIIANLKEYKQMPT